ncbi:hypothetical protein QFZ58_000114 [Streptomyces sp. B1I3]|nr:hypothetical protein [Streptomyces sp. B1I3]
MAAGIALTAPALWVLVTVALVLGAVDALFVAAVGALPPRITAPDQLARVTGMRSLSMRLSQIAEVELAFAYLFAVQDPRGHAVAAVFDGTDQLASAAAG